MAPPVDIRLQLTAHLSKCNANYDSHRDTTRKSDLFLVTTLLKWAWHDDHRLNYFGVLLR